MRETLRQALYYGVTERQLIDAVRLHITMPPKYREMKRRLNAMPTPKAQAILRHPAVKASVYLAKAVEESMK